MNGNMIRTARGRPQRFLWQMIRQWRMGDFRQFLKQAARKQLELYGDDERKLNALGLLYVRAGMYADAISVFERAALHGSVSAMNNLGNIAMLQKRYADAQNWYRQALLRDPANTAAQRGLERATAERGE